VCFFFHHRLGTKSCYVHYGMQHHNRITEQRLCGCLWFVYTVTSVIEWQWWMWGTTELGVVLSERASVGRVKCVSVDHSMAPRNRFAASRGTSLFCHKTGGRSGFFRAFSKGTSWRWNDLFICKQNWHTKNGYSCGHLSNKGQWKDNLAGAINIHLKMCKKNQVCNRNY